MGRISTMAFALAIPTHLIQAASLGDGIHSVERRQGNIGLNPTLSFDRIGNLTTCEPATIRWFYAGPPISMTITVTNIGVAQISLPPAPTTSTSSSSTPPPLENRQNHASVVDMEIATNVNPASSTFQWASVNITSGSYLFRASIRTQNFVQESSVFHVLRGPNTSCLPASHTSSSTQQHSTGPPTSTNTDVPDSESSPAVGASSTRINTPTIVGIVLGALALILVAVAIYFYIRNGRNRKHGGSSKPGSKNWNALNSTDSRANMLVASAKADNTPRSRHLSSAHAQRRNYSQSSSIGPTEETVVGGGLSEEKLGEYYNRKDSVASYDDSQAMALAALPSLPHHRPRRTTKGSYPDPAIAANMARRKSTDAKTRTSPYLPTIDSTTNTATVSPTSSFATPSELTHATTVAPDFSSSSSPDPKRANRQSFGRKRKPVPAYDSSTPASPIPPSPMASESHLSHSTNLNTSGEIEMGYMNQSPTQTQTQSPSTAGHYSTRNGLSRPGTSDSNELLHKTSFGVDGKPVHYLMPDLPVEAQMQAGNGSNSTRR